MDLQEFVEQTLLDISNAVDISKHKIAENGKNKICPSIGFRVADRLGLREIYDHINFGYHQQIEFDIAVTVEREVSGGGKSAIKVFGLGEASAGGKVASSNSTVSRVKFHIPIFLSSQSEENTQ